MNRTIIRAPGRLNLPRWRELWSAREVLWSFGLRDLVLRYRQTAIGVGWVVLQPLVSAGVFSLVFGQIAGLSSNGVPYFLFAFVGMLAWNVFNGVVSRASVSLVANQALVSKVFFPRLLVPLSSVVSVAVDFLVGLALLLVLWPLYGVAPGLQVLLIPVWLASVVLLSTGIGAAAAAVTVRYRDVTYLLPWVLQIALYATPVAYGLDTVPARLRWLFELNPLTWLMEVVRWTTLGQPAPPIWQVVALPAISVVVFLAGVLVFQRFERAFADFI